MKTMEQLRQDYPQMPAFIGEMIMEEVARQVSASGSAVTTKPKTLPVIKKNRYRKKWLLAGSRALTRAAVILAAILLCSGTAYAAVKLYLQYRKEEAHTATVALSGGLLQSENAIPTEVPVVEQIIGYIPDGLIADYKGEGSFKSVTEDYGYFIGEPLFADTVDPLHIAFLQEIESIRVGEYDGLYTKQSFSSDRTWSWQRVYILYPEVHRIVSVVGWGRAPREELLQIAESIDLVETGETVPASSLSAWSETVENLNTQYEQLTENADAEGKVTATATEMCNLHGTGEAFPVKKDGSLLATVTDVQFFDDFSPLAREDQIQESWLSLLDENGKIGSAVMTYIKPGDGVNTMNEVIKTEAHPLKLVYVTVDYRNNTGQDMENVWFFGGLMALEEANGSYRILNDEFADGTHGKYLDQSMIGSCELPYCDVTGGERNNNYIPEIKAGESATVHMAWLVEEEKLDKLFISINAGPAYTFNDAILDVGLVDLNK